MYDFFMDLFERYPSFFTFFVILCAIGLLAVLYIIALIFYKIIAGVKGSPKAIQSDIDKKQNEAIESLTKETKKALALEKELAEIRERLKDSNR